MSLSNPMPSSSDPGIKQTKRLFLYYKKLYDVDGKFLEKAECGFCHKHHKYRNYDSDGALWRHLKRSHGVTRAIVDKVQEEITRRETEMVVNTNVPIYRYFTVSKNGKAKCRVCTSASLPTPLIPNHATPMKVHLQTHPRAYKLYELEVKFGETGPQYDESIHQPVNSLPSVITLDPEGTYHCNACDQTMTGGINEIQNHLKANHPDLAGQVAGTDDVLAEVVYVGDKKKKKPIRRHKQPIPAPSNTISKMTSERNTRTLSKISLNDDLDTFSLYITSLLRNMPKDDCTKVQQTIMNKIYEAKLNVNNDKPGQEKNIERGRAIKITAVTEDDAVEQEEYVEEPVAKPYKYAITADADILELS